MTKSNTESDNEQPTKSLEQILAERVQAAMPQAGDSFRLFYGEDNPFNKLIHVRAVVDDSHVVYRYWQDFRWVYVMESAAFFYVNRNSMTKAESQ